MCIDITCTNPYYYTMAFSIYFNEEKNQLLKATRGVGFDEIINVLAGGGLVADLAHPSRKHCHQRLYAVRIKQYVYAVPYVIDQAKNQLFLKTVYPSRTLTKKYIKGENNDK